MKLACLIAAVILFALATIVALGFGNFVHSAALIPAGLMFGFSSFLPWKS